MKPISVILLAGGKGTRMKREVPKQFLQLGEKLLLSYSLEFFQNLPHTEEIIVVVAEEYRSLFKEMRKAPLKFADPGKRRQDSVLNGLKQVSAASNLVCIHDAARPFLDDAIISQAIEEACLHGAAALAVPLKFTVKEEGSDGFIKRTLDRSCLYEMQTPQIIEKNLLWEGFHFVEKHNLEVTDDLSLLELIKKPAKLVMGSYQNIKITTEEDLSLATILLEKRDAALL